MLARALLSLPATDVYIPSLRSLVHSSLCMSGTSQQLRSLQEHDLTRVNDLSVSEEEMVATETLSVLSMASPFLPDVIVISL